MLIQPDTSADGEEVFATTSEELLPEPDIAYTLQLGRINSERNTQTDILVRVEISDTFDQLHVALRWIPWFTRGYLVPMLNIQILVEVMRRDEKVFFLYRLAAAGYVRPTAMDILWSVGSE